MVRKIVRICFLTIFSFFLVQCDFYDTHTESAENNTIYSTETIVVISFDSQGGNSIDNICSTPGTTIILPEPTREGYTFLGWYTGNGVNDAQFTLLTVVTRNLTLYARWQINQYTITYISNGGTLLDSAVLNFESIIIPPCNPTKIGYTFGGWYIDELFTVEFSIITMPADNLTLYAKWNICTYSISFVDETGAIFLYQEVQYGVDLGDFIFPEGPIREGYTFLMWDNELPDFMPNFDLTVHAIYSVNPYTVYFNCNGGSEISPVSELTTYPPRPLNPVKEGYTFAGWFLDTDLLNEYDFSTIPGNDFTLYARWHINQFTIRQLLESESIEGSSISGIILGVTIIGKVEKGFFFTDGVDILFFYTNQFEYIEVGRVYNIAATFQWYCGAPEMISMYPFESFIEESEAAISEIPARVGEIHDIISDLAQITPTGHYSYIAYKVTARIYSGYVINSQNPNVVYGVNYNTFLVPIDFDTNTVLDVSATDAIMIYYQSNLEILKTLSNHVVTIDIIIVGYRLDLFVFYADFLGEITDICIVT